MPDNKTTLAVVVNGSPVELEVAVNAPLRTVIPRALAESGNQGQPPENWELRDAAGNALDVDRKIDSFDFEPDTKLFLNLKAGVGGRQ